MEEKVIKAETATTTKRCLQKGRVVASLKRLEMEERDEIASKMIRENDPETAAAAFSLERCC